MALNISDLQQNTVGMIDVYRGKSEKVGIDAIVSQSLAFKMLSEIMPTASRLYVYQPRHGGMVAIDAQVPARMAAKMLAVAKRGDVSID